MSRFWKWGGAMLLAAMIMLAAPAQKANAQPGVSVSFQTFYDALSPHGQWIDDPTHGYVWAPRGVGSDFRPYYSGGRWAMTDYGNTWVSDYTWGWAPFHYGRWAYDPFYGWIWVPGNTWGPAWVSWRGGGNSYGWAPMGPGVNINISIGPRYAPPADWWVFVPCNRIYQPGGYGRYWRGARYNNTYINNTTIINNTYITNNNTYITGPRRAEVERTTGQRINVYNVRNDNNPGRSRMQGREVNMYRPDVRQDRNATYRPQNVVRADRGNGREAGVRQNAGSIGNTERRMQNEQVRANNSQPDARMTDNRQRDMQVQQESRNRDARVQQQREQETRTHNMQAQQENRNREARVQQQRAQETRTRDMQAQQESRNREARVQQQREQETRTRDMQAQQESRNREARVQQQREQESRMRAQQEQQRYQAQADRQRESQQRIEQQRAAEQRAQQQQQIESRRQQRWDNQQPQQRTNSRSGSSMQRGGSSETRQAPQGVERRSGATESRSRR